MAVNDLTYVNSASTSTNLNDGSTYDLREIRGIYRLAAEPVLTPLTAAMPAAAYEAHNAAVRRIEVDLRVYGATLSALMTNLRVLRARMYVDIKARAFGTLTYTSFNSNVRAAKVVPISAQTDVEQWIRNGTAKPGWALVTLLFDAPDPTFYDPTPVVYNGALAGVASVNISCVNSGDADAYPSILWTNQATTPKVADANGDWCRFADSLADGDSLTANFDPLSKSFLEDDGTNWRDQREAGSALVVVPPGTANMVFTGYNAADDATIAVTVYSRYSGHG